MRIGPFKSRGCGFFMRSTHGKRKCDLCPMEFIKRAPNQRICPDCRRLIGYGNKIPKILMLSDIREEGKK